ncbi:restriction endonuclease subunit S [bacterium]|nr:restriction endonuclease subunit S [bacterium]
MKYPAYPKYKPSGFEWLGEVPEHWEIKKIRYLALLKSGENITSEQIEETGEYPVFGGNGIRGYSSRFTHHGHFVLIGRQGALCGNVNYASEKFWASEHAVVVSPLTAFATVWMGELLRAMDLNQYSVSAAQPGLSVDKISALKIPVPPLPEQRAIAEFLDRETAKLDTLVAKKQELIEKLKEKRTALISRTVTRGLPPEAARAARLDPNPKLKPSGIEWLGEVPEHWVVKKIRHLALLKSGENITSEELEDDGEFPVFGGNGIRGYSSRFSHEGHYVLIGRQGALCGNINYAKGKFWASEHAVVVSPLTEFATAWLGELLRAMNLNQYSISAAQPGLSIEMINRLNIPVPPLSEQRAIADYLDRETAKIDQMAAKVEEAIARLQEYRTALITAAVTGKIDVREYKDAEGVPHQSRG